MSSTSIEIHAAPMAAPLADFSECHHQFVATLHAALYLPELVASAARARALSGELLRMFRHGLIAHHRDEECELFPAVQHAAEAGEERARVDAMVDQLVREHRDMEGLWKRIEPSISEAAAGGTPTLEAGLMEVLVQHFFAHVHFEEQDFLPLAQQILGRKSEEMAALGLALHTRHSDGSGI